MGSDRSCGWFAALAGALVLAVGVMLAGCGGADDPASRSKTPESNPAQTTPATAKEPAGTTDRGARRCTRTAILAALLADVDQLPFKVDRVRCKGEFARSRFAYSSCPAGKAGPACDRAKVAVWRRGAKRWRLITYAVTLTCAEIRRAAADFPQSLCG
jgi:hypothetical protein